MKYKKVGIFGCDIYNTYLYRNENHFEELQKFIFNLEKIIKLDSLDILYFSFITTADKNIIEEAMEDIKYHLPNNIILVEQFFYRGYIYNKQVSNYDYNSKGDVIHFLIKKYNPIMVYYADDELYNHYSVSDNVIHFLLGNEYNNYYCSNKKGLNGLNMTIEKYLC